MIKIYVSTNKVMNTGLISNQQDFVLRVVTNANSDANRSTNLVTILVKVTTELSLILQTTCEKANLCYKANLGIRRCKNKHLFMCCNHY